MNFIIVCQRIKSKISFAMNFPQNKVCLQAAPLVRNKKAAACAIKSLSGSLLIS
ncbi:MAG: hypothetical protein ACI39H_07685 [Lachnospiraceae bacterium]